MGKLLVNDKDIVVPGEELATGMDYLPAFGVFREKESLIASRVGIVNISGRLVKLIPLGGRYTPKRDDVVIGKILDMTMSSWFVDINYIADAVMSLKEVREYIPRGADLASYYNYGEWVIAKISRVSKTKSVEIGMRGPGLRKLESGRILRISPSKIPRIIGREGSMISMIKDMTNCQISVGQNGFIWLKGEDPEKERIAVETIQYVEKESHKSGLTEKVKEFLEKNVKGKKEEKEIKGEKDVHKKK